MPKILLCPPEHYGIEYEINPWMNKAQRTDSALARKQWDGLRQKLEQLGCELELLEPREKLPDMVFTANAGLVEGNRFIRSNFRFAERRGEEEHFERWFAAHGYEVARLPENLFFEGEGDALFCAGTLFCGYRFRSDIRSHQWLGDFLKCLVISVELVQDRFYHLDTCFCPLTERSAVWFPAAFDEYGQRTIRARVPELIDAPPEEAAHFGCNAVVIGRDVVLPESCPKLCEELARAGFTTHALPMTEFLKAGGACKCLTLFLPHR